MCTTWNKEFPHCCPCPTDDNVHEKYIQQDFLWIFLSKKKRKTQLFMSAYCHLQ